LFQVINERREYLRLLKEPQTPSTQKENSKRKNLAFLDMLLKAEEDGEKFMSQKDIRDQVSTFMFEVSSDIDIRHYPKNQVRNNDPF
jgi:cytochrome P450